ncbi:hypothetical protein PoB_000404700 [Plakobranchus ocellatus]|uniref:Uncharacterized protein n=1 Tax=Plakobranchus ocellatus TaxID=259542 RepID=A0AAV3Y5Y3_9GAST|nr:hypothetical protein PoB_000404700 [Plakobranchus ocellatus]
MHIIFHETLTPCVYDVIIHSHGNVLILQQKTQGRCQFSARPRTQCNDSWTRFLPAVLTNCSIDEEQQCRRLQPVKSLSNDKTFPEVGDTAASFFSNVKQIKIPRCAGQYGQTEKQSTAAAAAATTAATARAAAAATATASLTLLVLWYHHEELLQPDGHLV